MNVVSVNESWTGIEWSGDTSQRQTTRVFTVETDTPGRGVFTFPIQAGEAPDAQKDIPAEGTAHPDNAAFISGVPTIRTKGPTYFEISIGYKSVGISGAAMEWGQDPLAQPVDISWEDEDQSVPYDMDVDTPPKPVANTMGQFFNPPLTRPVSDSVLVIERSEAAFTPTTKLTYQDTICGEVFWGAAVGRTRMGKIRARSVNAATPFWRVSYRVIFRTNTPVGVDADADAWKRIIANVGTKYKDVNAVEQKTEDGEWVPLDADSKKTTAATPHWLKFVEFKPLSWAALGINNT